MTPAPTLDVKTLLRLVFGAAPFDLAWSYVMPKYKGYKWQCLTTHESSRQHNEPQQIFGVDQVTEE